MAKKPLLDLQTLVDRPFITIDGKDYELYSPDELPVLQSQRLSNWGREIEALAKSLSAEDTSPEQQEAERAFKGLIDKVARAAMVDIPDDVFAKLQENQKQAIVEVFTGLLLRRKLAAAGAIANQVVETVNRMTGAKSFPGSAGSTAETQATGSNARRAH